MGTVLFAALFAAGVVATLLVKYGQAVLFEAPAPRDYNTRV